MYVIIVFSRAYNIWRQKNKSRLSIQLIPSIKLILHLLGNLYQVIHRIRLPICRKLSWDMIKKERYTISSQSTDKVNNEMQDPLGLQICELKLETLS